MILVSIKDATTNYILTAEIQPSGDLVVSASDFSPSIKESFETDEYEYFYVVKAADVARVHTALGITDATLPDELLLRLRALLEPQGYTASTHWKAWLVANNIPYDFSVWR